MFERPLTAYFNPGKFAIPMRKCLFTHLAIFLCTLSFTADLRAENAPAVTAPKNIDSEYLIGPENALQVDIYYGKGEKISQKVRVSSRGVISLPLLGEVEAAGLTVAGLQEKVTKLLAQDYLVNPQVTIYIEEYSTVSIVGEVKKPGAYPIKGKLTILGLVSTAEGFTRVAAPNKVKIIRIQPDGSVKDIPVMVSNIMGNASNQDNVLLQAGDVIVVPQSIF